MASVPGSGNGRKVEAKRLADGSWRIRMGSIARLVDPDAFEKKYEPRSGRRDPEVGLNFLSGASVSRA
jgi:hypothetical protein